jgi:hypothetical protein|tara:strand:+ start:9 stop:224 length:216 start_codon:yes stop_codon:yes gene_type:complete
MKLSLLTVGIALIVFASCKKSEVTAHSLECDYYPIEVGDCKVYEVDCIVFNDFSDGHLSFFFERHNSKSIY